MDATNTEQRVLAATRRYLVERDDGEAFAVKLDDAVCQDLMIFGIDVEDYVGELEKDFGEVVWTIPWLHYTEQTSSFRGCGCFLVPPWVLAQLMRKLFRGGALIPSADPREHPFRLTLREVAGAIDAGGWPKEWKAE